MPDTPSITIVQKFTYRGVAEEYSNTYHFSGTVPTTYAGWKALADGIIAAKALAFPSHVSFVRAYGYEAGNENSVAQIDYTLPPNTVSAGAGTFGTNGCAGDQAGTTRWFTGAVSSRGKKIYCRKYWHGVMSGGGVPNDNLNATQRTALQTFGAKLIDGTLPGSFKYCGPQGAVLQAPETSTWLTTRTLKRRGKRPPLAGGP